MAEAQAINVSMQTVSALRHHTRSSTVARIISINHAGKDNTMRQMPFMDSGATLPPNDAASSPNAANIVNIHSKVMQNLRKKDAGLRIERLLFILDLSVIYCVFLEKRVARSEAFNDMKPDCSAFVTIGSFGHFVVAPVSGFSDSPMAVPASMPATCARLPPGLGPAIPVEAMTSAAVSIVYR